MIVLSVLTMLNVRNRIVRPLQAAFTFPTIVPLTVGGVIKTKLRRKRDRQLVRLALVQVASYMVLNITTCIHPLYSYLTKSQSATNADQRAIINFVSTIGLILLCTYSAVSIYNCISTVRKYQIFYLFR
jgi:hypothetical protein